MVVLSLQVPFRTLNEQKTRSAGYPAKQRICRNCSKISNTQLFSKICCKVDLRMRFVKIFAYFLVVRTVKKFSTDELIRFSDSRSSDVSRQSLVNAITFLSCT